MAAKESNSSSLLTISRPPATRSLNTYRPRHPHSLCHRPILIQFYRHRRRPRRHIPRAQPIIHRPSSSHHGVLRSRSSSCIIPFGASPLGAYSDLPLKAQKQNAVIQPERIGVALPPVLGTILFQKLRTVSLLGVSKEATKLFRTGFRSVANCTASDPNLRIFSRRVMSST